MFEVGLEILILAHLLTRWMKVACRLDLCHLCSLSDWSWWMTVYSVSVTFQLMCILRHFQYTHIRYQLVNLNVLGINTHYGVFSTFKVQNHNWLNNIKLKYWNIQISLTVRNPWISNEFLGKNTSFIAFFSLIHKCVCTNCFLVGLLENLSSKRCQRKLNCLKWHCSVFPSFELPEWFSFHNF